MPELPEVETTVRGLEKVLLGKKLESVKAFRNNLRRPIPEDIIERLEGCIVSSLGRRAKYGLIFTNRQDVLVFHLGMSGRWRIDPSIIEKHDHFLIKTADGCCVTLYDPRRFGSLDLVKREVLAIWPYFLKLGPEPLSDDFTVDFLAEKLTRYSSSIKKILLNQNIVAGLGNIYVCETLYKSGIHPSRSGKSLNFQEIESLVKNIKLILEEAISKGGSTLRDYAQPDGELGYFSNFFQVYGKEGDKCQCGTPIMRSIEGGRSTYFCPSCQK
ncbi:MAG: bifunctional DNA-formamidopyrimidine glycosylase/DNA-(apurinic or apyrimidinic site) lyase [Zymomonas mobilis subsp. pomaceae]|uniref:Formamidopyrimidine-DNA glycosylase n=1 Tax=Zymomonas mobilis subsp. pomaceae (strain ATCC 29192 / DSM 22645 / JCM 10191 / CCUG 17912 / NBRC 13757 / NCIMB 11200 / NRRL B-4491 / Barker I) TaxID=579138 RepID=F8ETK8_ZYMMT|nr:bifunctional DNA-formamidopyrimidine glycosylase/DNA-(apurinic or apyrimidinic site) lyase [Zymomonas mobilis]AEI37018.1 formamidopyrimidine-DNA glycosylase [Zymomonas mobilis subsp. pomaceae ATCC 29192]MDX5948390.1 bifunctional DNA-formamidopyrimidine glycosylase/DNA-(apurinic or apyrimidinic site) lyase [Zymomonas mobilis subsp. pomaceae]GEB89620.1 formamidopyrimidine-DNA glycosylase [Zymomonas mobilis subsp. pomaceae]